MLILPYFFRVNNNFRMIICSARSETILTHSNKRLITYLTEIEDKIYIINVYF